MSGSGTRSVPREAVWEGRRLRADSGARADLDVSEDGRLAGEEGAAPDLWVAVVVERGA